MASDREGGRRQGGGVVESGQARSARAPLKSRRTALSARGPVHAVCSGADPLQVLDDRLAADDLVTREVHPLEQLVGAQRVG